MVLILLLLSCAFLCFPHKGETLQCREASSSPWEEFLPPSVCEADPEKQTCHAIKVYLNDDLQIQTLSCRTKKDAKCGISEAAPFPNQRTEFFCCEVSDFCNDKFLTAQEVV